MLLGVEEELGKVLGGCTEDHEATWVVVRYQGERTNVVHSEARASLVVLRQREEGE